MKIKKTVLSSVCTAMMILPWLLFFLRGQLERLHVYSGAAVIFAAAFFIFCGIFTVYVYFAAGVRTDLLRLCMIVNGIYAVFAFVLLVMIMVERVTPI